MRTDNPPAPISVWSAGGVLLRRNGSGKVQVVVCHRRQSQIWSMPKGTPNADETREQTAIREVREETGLEPRVVLPLDSIRYTFTRGGANLKQFDKTVYFYLMESIGGALENHDHEFDEVFWSDSQQALGELTYPTEVKIVRQAISKFKP